MRLFVFLPSPVARFAFPLLAAALLVGCASDETASSGGGGWSLWPWDVSKAADATANIEYQRTRTEGKEPMYNLIVRNTHLTKTIEGRMETTMQPRPGDVKVDSQSFTLSPSEEKKLLTYPVRMPLTYEVTAFFRE